MRKISILMSLVFLMVVLLSLVDYSILFTDVPRIPIAASARKTVPQERVNNNTAIINKIGGTISKIGGFVTFFEYPNGNHTPYTVYSTKENRWEYSNAFNESAIEELCTAACQNISHFEWIKVYHPWGDPDYHKFPRLYLDVYS